MSVPSLFLAGSLGVLYNFLFWGKPWGISVPLFAAAAVLAVDWLGRRSGKPFLKSYWIAAGSAFLFSLCFAWRGAHEARVANLALALYMVLLLIAAWAKGKPLTRFALVDYFFLPASFLVNAARNGIKESQAAGQGLPAAGPRARHMAIGGVAALPLLVVFLWLMAAADPAFHDSLKRLWDHGGNFLRNFEVALLRLLFVAAVTVLCLGLFSRLYKIKPEGAAGPAGKAAWNFHQCMTAAALVNGLFLIFTVFQVRFFFEGKARVFAQMTAREGFYQMAAIGLLAYAFCTVIDAFMERENARQETVLKANVAAMSLMTFVIMSSAFYRFWLYEEAFGFTLRRFYAHAAVPYVAVIFGLLAWKVAFQKARETFLFLSFLCTVTLFLILNVLNPHGLVAAKNVAFHEKHPEKMGTVYLEMLSSDAVPALAQGLPRLTGAARASVEDFLAKRAAELARLAPSEGLVSFHWGRHRARKALASVLPPAASAPDAQDAGQGKEKKANFGGFLLLVFLVLVLGFIGWFVEEIMFPGLVKTVENP